MNDGARKLLKLMRVSALAVPLFVGGCVSQNGESVPFFLYSPPPNVTGIGSSPECPLKIKHASKDELGVVEASWMFKRYRGPNEVMDDSFYRRLKIETHKTGNRVYDVATLTMPDGAVRIAYFDVTSYRRDMQEGPAR